MNILKIKVLVSSSRSDIVFVETDLPNPLWPFTGNLDMRFEVAQGKGVDYVREHFKLEPTLIDAR